MEIIIENLSKSFGRKQALNQVNLKIETGMFGLLGRNGAGKTTLMRILAALSTKSQGRVTIDGVPVEKAKEIHKLVGYLPQDFSMYPSMTVYQAMDYLGVLSELPKNVRQERIEKLLEKVNLSDSKRVKVKALSGGMKRRLGIAQALLHDPKILIVDEPTAGLDPEERIRFRNLLCETAENRIVLLSTHIAGDIEATCQHVAILNDGELIYKGTTNELAAFAEGRVYTVEVPHRKIEAIKQQYTVLGMLTQGQTAVLRVLADGMLPEGAVPCTPTIEDGYMECLRRDRRGI